MEHSSQTISAAASAGQRFELSNDHLAVLAQLPIPEAWRYCVRKRRDVFTPDFATFVRAVVRMGLAAYSDLRSEGRSTGGLLL